MAGAYQKYSPTFQPLSQGTVYGNWTVEEYVGHSIYWCACICGERRKISSTDLKKEIRIQCRECLKLSDDDLQINKMFGYYQQNAKQSNREFVLSKIQFRELVCAACHYCGDWDMTNGIDRVDNSLGYVLGNCVPCCSMCNRMKYVLSKKVFLAHVTRIATYSERI